MNIRAQEVSILIKHYEVLNHEIGYEGEEQLATIARVAKHNIPLTIEKLKRLQELELLVPELYKQIRELEGVINGKAAHRAAETSDKAAV